MGFQSSLAFQTPLAFQAQFAPATGGFLEKEHKEPVFYDIYTGRKAPIPEPVKEIIETIAKQDLPTKKERKAELKSALPDIEQKVLKLYVNILEDAYNRWVESEIKRLLQEQTLRFEQQEQDELIILLLLNAY